MQSSTSTGADSLVEITEETHGVMLDIKYATSDNITGKPIYDLTRCYLRREAEEKLRIAVELLLPLGLRIKIFDGYRPEAAQKLLWAACPDPDYIIPPEVGSNHTRGIAVDMTLVTSDGAELDMGTGFDDMTVQSHHRRSDIPVIAQKNRFLLQGVMSLCGWVPQDTEWWHYQLPGDDWPLLEGASTGLIGSP
ncbi:D-alanyl-D-alanine dipeptidase [Sneathiella litorea]|uniref:D-alanyl-D-alanine dipeptidase n=1 Tax=Sneathiella litorea TaxID=2606216 RepID=A0A6L8W5R9_9PROT|nr:D-alanyl-D-alanine dipeptidase [Sneathiella litorea]MZR29842.1 D-alanyl-D-alanine dipeptidase [Sneathiella litorea]